jgi:alpha,alpha-trehalase
MLCFLPLRSGTDSVYPPIADYAIVGDCHTAALIGRDTSIDWLCPRRFDAPAVFCRLLDERRGGYLRTAPPERFTSQRAYCADTNVLETELAQAGARVRLTDLMPVHQRSAHRRGQDVGSSQRLLRLVEGAGGELELEVVFKPTFNFARDTAEISTLGGLGVVAQCDGEYLTLACRAADFQHTGDGAVRGRMRLRAGERQWVVLTSSEDPDRARESLTPARCDDQLERTLDYWRRWSAVCTYHGPYRQQVLRSALVLKLLTYEPTGAVVAAPTTSLPESIGGSRNWDYRYTWLRDASLILYALMTLGYDDEGTDFMHWLEHTIGDDPTRTPQIMYGIDSCTELPEHVLDHLEGYRCSAPVRVGNAAASQRQLDIYGEVLRAAALHYRRPDSDPAQAWPVLRGLVEQAAANWQQPGHGIWEVRSGPTQYTYGKLMCWAAVDAGVKLASHHGLDAPLSEWCRTRDAIRDAILQHAYADDLGAFTQAFGNQTLDASSLIIPRIGFLPPADARVRSTVRTIHERLTRHGQVYRYRTPDGLRGSEGTFTLCTFWLADALALEGSLDAAHDVFARGLSATNDLGLLAEEVDPGTGEQLGNFPQGFSHLALVGAAVDLARVEAEGREEQSRTEAERA